MVDTFFNTIKSLKEYDVLNLIAIIVSPIISFVILIFTLRHDKKQFEAQLKNQQYEHRETMDLMKEQHEQALLKQTEVNKISIMPYLIIDRNIKTRIENNHLYFTISFVNKGNGTAIELTGKYLDESSSYLCPLFKSINAIYGCACPFDYENNVVTPNEKCSFEMYQMLNEDINKVDTKNLDKVSFKILFKDMYLNQYEQEFLFLFSESQRNGQIEIQRVASYTPKIIVSWLLIFTYLTMIIWSHT